LLKNLFSLGFVHRRHSGECRNPEPRRVATLRFFIPHSLVGIQKKQKTKAKSLDSGIRRNDEQNRIRP